MTMMNTRMGGADAARKDRLLSTESSQARLTFRRADLPAVRRFATAFGAHAGMGVQRLADFVLAVSEAAACAVSHGPCTARLWLWTTGSRVFGEIRGDGMLLGVGARAVEQGEAEALRRSLLARICDNARVDDEPQGVTVVFSITIA